MFNPVLKILEELKMIKFKIVNKFGKETLYSANNGKKWINFNVEDRGRDGIGNLKRVECSLIGMFEEYSITKIKNRIKELFEN